MVRSARASRTFYDVNDGASGLNNATVSVFQRSATQPTTIPSTALRYIFASGSTLFQDAGTPGSPTVGTAVFTPITSNPANADRAISVVFNINGTEYTGSATVDPAFGSASLVDPMIETGMTGVAASNISIEPNTGNGVVPDLNSALGNVGSVAWNSGTNTLTLTLTEDGPATVTMTTSGGLDFLTDPDGTLELIQGTAAIPGDFDQTSSNGWYTTIAEVPSGSGDIWFRQAAAIGAGVSDDIETSQWGGAAQAGSTGANGAPGLNSATVYRYQRTSSNSAPGGPNSEDTYTFATTAVSPATNNSWTLDIPAASSGGFIWIIAASVSGITTSASIPANTWSEPVLLAQRGDTGTNGLNSRIDFAYATNISGTTGFSTTNSTLGFRGTHVATWREGTTPPAQSTVSSNYDWAQWTGDTGSSGPRSVIRRVYLTDPQTIAPNNPSATSINYATGAITGLLPNTWQATPPTVTITSTTLLYWSIDLQFTENTFGGTQTVTALGTASSSINFGTDIQSDSFVSGSAGWQIQRDTGNAEFNDINVRGEAESPNYTLTSEFNDSALAVFSSRSSSSLPTATQWNLTNGTDFFASVVSYSSWNDWTDNYLAVNSESPSVDDIIESFDSTTFKVSIGSASAEFIGTFVDGSSIAYIQITSGPFNATGTPAASGSLSLFNSVTADIAGWKVFANGSAHFGDVDIGRNASINPVEIFSGSSTTEISPIVPGSVYIVSMLYNKGSSSNLPAVATFSVPYAVFDSDKSVLFSAGVPSGSVSPSIPARLGETLFTASRVYSREDDVVCELVIRVPVNKEYEDGNTEIRYLDNAIQVRTENTTSGISNVRLVRLWRKA